MPAFRSPYGDVIVEVAEGQESAYVAAGWATAGEPETVEKPFSQLNKSELVQVASDEGVDLGDAKTNDEIRDAIKAHRDSK